MNGAAKGQGAEKGFKENRYKEGEFCGQ